MRRPETSCPYLEEVRMVLCRAYPLKKPVPVERVTTASCCEGDAHAECPLYRESLARSAGSEGEAAGGDLPQVGPKGAGP